MGHAWLEVPEADVPDPVITVLVPAMDEAETIGTFIEWCHEGIADAGLPGEIIIVDSSKDETPRIALAGGARVLHTEPRGLGAAYIEGIRWVRGSFVVLGDADCTYDFRELARFVEQWQAGSTFVMGSRFKGSIEDGAMPRLHRYFGTPVTTWMLNRIFGSRFSDIHCGMRGVDAEALRAMTISSPSWEYASEMIIKAVEMELPTSEVPIDFYADRGTRQSHMKRKGPLEPFRAGWRNVKAMLTFGAPYFLRRPGQVILALGALLFLGLALGPVDIGSLQFSATTQLVGAFLLLLGLQMILLATVAQVVTDYHGRRRLALAARFDLNRMLLTCSLTTLLGVLLWIPLVGNYLANDRQLIDLAPWQFSMALGGIVLIIAAFCLFTAALVIQLVSARIAELIGSAQRPTTTTEPAPGH